METQPLTVERIYNAPVEKVWRAITETEQMKEWYFELEEFKADQGFKFQFTGGDKNVQYLHECTVIVADPPHKLSYSWVYPEHNDGYSVVTWELFEEEEQKTRLKLTHEGLESFPEANPNFAVASFTQGWNSILGESLKNYLEEEVIKRDIPISANAEVIWDVILNPANQWGEAFGGGAFVKTDWKPGSEVVWTDLSGDVGARGVVKEHRPMDYLRVDMFDDVDPAPASETGAYAEIYQLTKVNNDQYKLTIESGPLPLKYITEHAKMWDKAIEIIKEISENKNK